MKKQYFYIFHSENEKYSFREKYLSREKYEVPSKLVKTYMNYFCINEDNQSEVIEIHTLESTRKIFNLLNPDPNPS